MMRLMLLISVVFLSGCGSVAPFIQRGAAANDSAVQAAEFTICNGASIGAIRRAYGDRPRAWELLCSRDQAFALPGATAQ